MDFKPHKCTFNMTKYAKHCVVIRIPNTHHTKMYITLGIESTPPNGCYTFLHYFTVRNVNLSPYPSAHFKPYPHTITKTHTNQTQTSVSSQPIPISILISYDLYVS